MVKKYYFYTLRVMMVVMGISLLPQSSLLSQPMPPQNHMISLQDADRYIQNFKNNPTVVTIKAGYFSRAIFDTLLSQQDCVGIRYYYAKLDDGSPTVVLVGVNGSGREITPGVLGETVKPCPPYCDSLSILNH